jgi:radical SAM protein with 4Fe4S-binding SPASM domain
LRKSLIISFDSPHVEGISVTIPALPPLTDLYVEITSRCNLNCIHCDVNAGKSQGKEVSLEKIKECIDYLVESKGVSIYLSGGEPLLRKGWDGLLEYSLTKGLRTTVATNGTLINEEVADIFELYDPQDLIIQISLDSTKKEVNDFIRGKNAFDRTINGIKHLLDRGMGKNVRISFTANKYNVSDAKAMVDFCLEKKLGEIIFSKVYKQGRAAAVWDTLKLSLKEAIKFQKFVFNTRKRLKGTLEVLEIEDKAAPAVGTKVRICNMGQEPRIDSYGNVYPCQLFHGEDAIIGNINNDSLQSIREGETFYNIRKRICERIDTIFKCKSCIWKNICAAGCAATAHFVYGDYTAIDPLCDFYTWWHEYLIVERIKQVGLYHIPY